MNKVKNNFYPFGEFPEDRLIVGDGIQLFITAVATVTFQFKLPSTKSLKIDWGNGTNETFAGQDAVEITKTKNYGAPTTATITFSADYKEVTWHKVNAAIGIANLTYDLSIWTDNTNLARLWVINTGTGVGGMTYSVPFTFPISLINIQISGAAANQTIVDAIIHSVFLNLAARPGAGLLNLLANVAPSVTGIAEAAAIAVHGWAVFHD